MELIGHAEMLVTNHQSTQHNIPDELRSHLYCAGNLKLRVKFGMICGVLYVHSVHEVHKISACRRGCVWVYITSPKYWSDSDLIYAYL